MATTSRDGGDLIVMAIGHIHFVSPKTFIGLKFKARTNVIKAEMFGWFFKIIVLCQQILPFVLIFFFRMTLNPTKHIYILWIFKMFEYDFLSVDCGWPCFIKMCTCTFCLFHAWLMLTWSYSGISLNDVMCERSLFMFKRKVCI